jgi:hypothetical protein
MSGEDCRVPTGKPARPARVNKRGSASSLTVLVLAVAAVLLIPIGVLGTPPGVDRYREDRPF